jgi:homoserine dehydrogenase
MKEVGIGLLGFGTVGAGVVEGLQRNADVLARRSGVRLVLRWIADLDLERDRGVTVDRALLTRDARAVVEDPQVNVIIELVGGTGIARELVTRALELGKPVVTANKKLLAEYGAPCLLWRRSRRRNWPLKPAWAAASPSSNPCARAWWPITSRPPTAS